MSFSRQVFLSHSSVDAALARRLTVDLIDLGADVWLDQLSLGVGEHILESIETAVDQTDLMLVLVSEQSIASGWVQLEWQRLGVAGGKIVPVRLVGCHMPDALASQAYIDLAGGAYWNGVAQIAQRIGIDGVRPGITARPMEPPISTPVKVELGSALTPLFERFAQPKDPAHMAAVEMRNRIAAQFGIMPPGIRYAGNDTDMPPNMVLIQIEDIPKLWFEITKAETALERIVARVEDVMIAHLDRFIDPDICSTLYEVSFLTDSEHTRATTGELTAIFREASRQRLDLADLDALDHLLPMERTRPLDVVGIAEELRPYQAARLSRMAATGNDIRALTLDPALESYAEGCLTQTDTGYTITLDPDWAHAVWQNVRAAAEDTEATTLIVENPVLRRYFERLQMAELATLARREVHSDVRLQVFGTVTLAGAKR